MNIEFQLNNRRYRTNLNMPLDISIPINNGKKNPSCYWADPVEFQTIKSGNFIGSVHAGGLVNHKKIIITPHGNGTHTECYGHITADDVTIHSELTRFLFPAELITIKPQARPDGDFVITADQIRMAMKSNQIASLVIRTSPNDSTKLTRTYSGTNPPYFLPEAMEEIVSRGVKHVLCDLPSVDKEQDEGKLAAHKMFWNLPDTIRAGCTITELIYVNPKIDDGLYLLNLQIISLESDASPSKPILYKLEEVS